MPSNCCRRAARVHKRNGFTLCAAVTVALTVNLTLIKGAAGTSQEPRQGYEPPWTSPAEGGGPFIKAEAKHRWSVRSYHDSVPGQAKGDTERNQGPNLQAPLSLIHVLCPHTHTHIYKCTGVRKKRKLTEPSASQVARQSGWKRCHQFVPSHRGHAGDGEAMAAPCPHHG